MSARRLATGFVVAFCALAVPSQSFAAGAVGGAPVRGGGRPDVGRPAAVRTVEPATEDVPSSSPLAPLNGHIFYSAAGFTITASATELGSVEPSALAGLRSEFTLTAAAIAGGRQVMGSGGYATTSAATASADRRVSPLWLHRFRHSFIASHWYGYQVGTDAWMTNKLENGFWVADGVAAVAALLGGGVLAVAIAAGLTIFAGSLGLCQKTSGWTYSYHVGSAIFCNPF